MRQIDSRIVDPGSQTLCAIGLDDEGFVVTIEDANERVLSTVYIGSDAEQAFDAYAHPFVSPKVEATFGRRGLVERIDEYAEIGVPI